MADNAKCWQEWTTVTGNARCYSYFAKTVWQFLVELNIHLLSDPGIPWLAICPRTIKTLFNQNTCAKTLEPFYLYKSKIEKTPNICQLTNGRTNYGIYMP